MTQLKTALLSNDLDHIIDQRPTELTGVSPVSIKDTTFKATQTQLEESRTVELNGVEMDLSATFSFNVVGLTTMPTIGSVLNDESGKYYKIMTTRFDDPNDPVMLTCDCIERYSGE